MEAIPYFKSQHLWAEIHWIHEYPHRNSLVKERTKNIAMQDRNDQFHYWNRAHGPQHDFKNILTIQAVKYCYVFSNYT